MGDPARVTTRGTNRAAVLHAPNDVRIEERPVPVPGPHEVLVELRAVGVCGSDVHYYEHGRIGPYVVERPLVLGHEPAGVVVALGGRVTARRVGDRVALEPGVPCGRCRQCREGRYNLCPGMRFFGTPPVDGAFARYVTIHEDFAHLLPEALSDEAGALMEPLAVAVWACRKAGVRPGLEVLVTGAGPIGQLVARTADAYGADCVTVTDVEASRLHVAESRGFRTIDVSGVTSLEPAGVTADTLIECSGSARALEDGIRCLRPAGTVVCVGMGPDETATVPLAVVQGRELWLTGTFRYANAYPAAIALAASGRVEVDDLVTARYALDETESALRSTRSEPGVLKAVVQPGSPPPP